MTKGESQLRQELQFRLPSAVSELVDVIVEVVKANDYLTGAGKILLVDDVDWRHADSNYTWYDIRVELDDDE